MRSSTARKTRSVVRLGATVLACALGGLVAARTALPDGREPDSGWRADFAEAQAEARRTGRPLLVHFHAEWCGPCRKMEQEFLGTPGLLRQIDGRFIAVKVDADRHAELVEKFDVQGLPCDVFVAPDGRVLSRSEGYQDRVSYLRRIAHVDAAFARARRLQLARDSDQDGDDRPGESAGAGWQAAMSRQGGADHRSRRTPGNSQPPKPRAAGAGQAGERAGVGQIANGSHGPTNQSAMPRLQRHSARRDPLVKPQPRLGLSGYSPVALWNGRRWVRGDPRFACEHKTVVYHMADAAELETFRQNPDRYTPRLLGCDPVVMADTDRAIPGSVRYGAFYRGELYLFMTQQSRSRFQRFPERYTRTRHVLRDDEIGGTRQQ